MPGTPSLLAGRSAVVTGASRGIGLAIARGLVGQGVKVALVARSADKLRAVARDLGSLAVACPCDLTDEAQVERLRSTALELLGAPPSIVVNNAGIFQLAKLDMISDALFVDTVNTNLIAPFRVLRAFVRDMRAAGRGHIVTIGSIADRVTMPENGAYSAAKYGMRAMHEVLRMELRGTGVRATLVSPSATDTALWDEISYDGRQLPSRDAMLAPAAVADAVLYALVQPETVNVDELRLSRS